MLFAFEHSERRIKSFQGHPKQNQHLPKPWPVTRGRQCQMHPTSWLWLCLPLCCMGWQVQFNRTQALKWVAEIHLTFRDLVVFSQTHVLEVSMLWFSKTQRYNNEHHCTHCLMRTQSWENGELSGSLDYQSEITEGHMKTFGGQGWAGNTTCLRLHIPNGSQVGSIVIVFPNEGKYDYM